VTGEIKMTKQEKIKKELDSLVSQFLDKGGKVEEVPFRQKTKDDEFWYQHQYSYKVEIDKEIDDEV
tara:strand:- start:203 stop:400 length:198 start_codon:yes stop_codon:yes gene_type:complete